MIEIPGQVSACQDASVDLGMQSLDPSAQDFRLSCIFGNFRDLQSGPSRADARAPAGQESDTALGQPAGQLDQPAFVRDAEQGSLNGNDLR